MLDELSQYGNRLQFQQDIWHGEELRSRMLVRVYTPGDYAGFAILFGEDEPVILEPESNEPF
jgi:hypothetical protein